LSVGLFGALWSCRSCFIIGLEFLDLTEAGLAVHYWIRAESVDFFASH
jgi:hypothetical protein